MGYAVGVRPGEMIGSGGLAMKDGWRVDGVGWRGRIFCLYPVVRDLMLIWVVI